jgi:ribosome recycling factor
VVNDILKQADPKMDKAIEYLREELRSIRTGRASTTLVDSLVVAVYGQPMQLKTIATISTPDARSIQITPWDRGNLQAIEKAIRESQSLGLTPNNDGANIRLNIPAMTEERRHEVVKTLGDKIEQCHIALRNIRHDILGEVRRLEKDKQATQDDAKYAEEQLNKKIDKYRGIIAEIEQAKTKEIMEV